jgi:site-specific DNA-methyltransferase (adenine-specific)
MKENLLDDFVDLTVTSPPYDDLRKYNGFVFDYKSMAEELYRVTKDGGVVVWIVGDQTIKGSETGTSFKHALYFKEIGFNLHDTMIYAKNNPVPLSHKRYEQQFEYMFILSKGKPKAFNPIKEMCKTAGQQYDYSKRKSATSEEINSAGRTREEVVTTKNTKIKGNIWGYTVGINQSTKDKVEFNHPAVFPEQLAEDHILSWSNEGDIVLDPMCGAGTTCKMAWLNNRKFLGIDMSEEYINDICIPRLNTYGWNEKTII